MTATRYTARYTATECLGHLEQAEREALEWVRAVKPSLDTAALEAYRAGFQAGARDALKMLRLHGGLAKGFDTY